MAEVLRGNLAQLSLLDILRMLSLGNRSGRLDIRQGGKSGEIYLERGSIVHAVTGTQIGDKGVYTLMGWLEGKTGEGCRRWLSLSRSQAFQLL